MASSTVFRFVFLAALIAVARAADGGPAFNYNRNAGDWDGVCQTGVEQSPINIDTSEEVELDDPALKVDVEDVGEVKGLEVWSSGAAINAGWKKFSRKPKIKVAAVDGDIFTIFNKKGKKAFKGGKVEKLDAEPIQFHFHAPSENTFDGRLAPLCVHIVCKISAGQSKACDDEICLIVLGVHFEYDDPLVDNPVLARLWDKIPGEMGIENGKRVKGKFDLNDLLPKNREHFTWRGSLTTPPCTEGVLWVMYSHPLLVSTDQVNAHQLSAAFIAGPDCEEITEDGECNPPRQIGNNRPVQPHYERVIRKSET